jgi:NADPH-dependent glutamate synthase beta subunit-like oxidoreductase/Pyruvate/2-oxoacid:ferredoxin oxidoreductase delta subunit
MALPDIPLRISASTISTEVNKTGFWRYVRPEFVQKTAPCSAACPAGEDIARVEKLVRDGLLKRALECILVENPFPAVCGRVCFHPCEAACNRQSFDEAVSIRCVERFLGDGAFLDRFDPAMFGFPPNGKKIAIAGAGPAGLSAAYFLTLLGYACTVFESQSEPGGVLRWGIPDYRLPVDVLEFEIERIRNLGVEIRCNTPLSEGVLTAIENEVSGVFLACGHGRSVTMGIAGEEHAIDGLSLLSDVKKGNMPDIEGPVVVIGGGNTAVDVSRTLVRMGVETTLVYRRRREDMPAFDYETGLALEEGVSLVELTAPVRLEKKDGGFVLHLQKMKTVGTAPEGRARVVPDTASVDVMTVKNVITAIGAQAEDSLDLPRSGREGNIALSHCGIVQGGIPRVYGGDLTNADKTVAHAVASGKQAAMVLDMMLSDDGDDPGEKIKAYRVGDGPSLSMEMYIGGERRTRNHRIVSHGDVNTDYFEPKMRARTDRVLLKDLEKEAAFSETEEALSKDTAIAESGRCFNCGICTGCDNCWLFCPEMAVIKDAGADRAINTDYCKGCGICVKECPGNAMVLREEPS